MKVLGIETSCDETAIAVVRDGLEILSNSVASSLKFHKKYGGIIPEIASRYHVEAILPLLKESLQKANLALDDIDLIAVTQGPGLIGSLMVGISFAKSLAYSLHKPIIGVDHLLAHAYAIWLNGYRIQFPYLALILSGGHSCLFLMKDFQDYKIIARTRDDALGEAFDKVARLLGLGFPGGPQIEKRAKLGKESDINFPLSIIKENYDFSFSGLKTAVLYWIKKKGKLSFQDISNACREFQEKAFETVIIQVRRVVNELKIKKIVLGGGVTANQRLRDKLKEEMDEKIKIYFPPKQLCGDNGAMVAGLGFRLYNKKKRSDFKFSAYANIDLK